MLDEKQARQLAERLRRTAPGQWLKNAPAGTPEDLIGYRRCSAFGMAILRYHALVLIQPSPGPSLTSSPSAAINAPATPLPGTTSATVKEDWSPADKWGAGTNAASAVIGTLSLIIALFAWYSTRTEANKTAVRIAEERRRVLELEALQDLGDILDMHAMQGGLPKNGRARTKLAMLKGGELPTWELLDRGGEPEEYLIENAAAEELVRLGLDQASRDASVTGWRNRGIPLLRAELVSAIQRRAFAKPESR